MKLFTHPSDDPVHIIRRYRQYLIGQKRVWMAQGMGSRCLRGLIHYRDFIDEYLAAKRLIFKTLNVIEKAESILGSEIP
jgi:hypothetical protein